MFDKILFGTIASGRPLAPPVAGEYLYAIASWTGESANQLALFGADTSTLVEMTGLAVSAAISIAVHPAGSHVAILSTTAPYLLVFETGTWSPVTISGLSISGMFSQSEVQFSHNGEYLIAATNSGLRVVRTSDWTVVASPQTGTGFFGLAISPDYTTVATSSSSSPQTFVLNTSDWSVVSGPSSTPNTSYGIAYSPDGTKVLYGITSGVVRSYNTTTWTHTDVASSSVFGGKQVAFSSDGSTFYAGVQQPAGMVRKYDTATMTQVTSVPLAALNTFRVKTSSSHDRLAVALNPGTLGRGLVIYDTNTMTELPLVGAATSSLVRAIAYGPAIS